MAGYGEQRQDFERKLLRENEELRKQLEEASNTIKRIKNLANQYYDQRSEYEEKEVEIPYWDIINALELKDQGERG